MRRNGNGRTSTAEMIELSLPPQNLDAERAVLGSMLKDNACIPRVMAMLRATSFYADAHQRMFRAIEELVKQDTPVDTVTLGEALRDRGWLVDVGGAPAIISLVDDVFTAANIDRYIEIVREKAMARGLIQVATDVLASCYAHDEPAGLASEAIESLTKLLQHGTASRSRPLGDMLRDWLGELEQRGDASKGASTGFRELDRMFRLRPSELVILAARPSVGKTALATNVAMRFAQAEGRSVLVISLEMREDEIVERIVASEARIDSEDLKSMAWRQHLDTLVETYNRLADTLLYVNDSPDQTVMQIEAEALRIKSRQPLGLMIVDYIQLIRADNRNETRQQQLTEISRRLKVLARKLDIPVIALSQLNRASEHRESRRPRLSDLRESGAIEQDADVVAMLYRPEEEDRSRVLCDLAKNRNGDIGTAELRFTKEYVLFDDKQTDWTNEPPEEGF